MACWQSLVFLISAVTFTGLLCLCACLYPNFPFFMKDTNHSGLGTHSTPKQPRLNVANTSAGTLFLNKVIFLGLRV